MNGRDPHGNVTARALADAIRRNTNDMFSNAITHEQWEYRQNVLWPLAIRYDLGDDVERELRLMRWDP